MSYIPKIAAGIRMDGNGIAKSINAMQLDMNVMGIFSENVEGFDKVGYQRKDAVISSFAEYIGTNALSYSTDTQVGRLTKTNRPLDIALSEKGYFQVMDENGNIELTRDGRFKLSKDGELLTQENQKVLSVNGEAIVLPEVPEDVNLISIGMDGKVCVFNKEKRGYIPVGKIGIVSEDSTPCNDNCVRQGYIESSNVALQREFIEMAPYVKSFNANRQMFKIQNSNLSTVIQTLGRV